MTRLLRTNSSQTTFEECLSNFKLRLKVRGYHNNFIERSLTGVRLEDRRLALQQRKKTQTKISPFVRTYHLAVRCPKEILMNNWVLIQNRPFKVSVLNLQLCNIRKTNPKKTRSLEHKYNLRLKCIAITTH